MKKYIIGQTKVKKDTAYIAFLGALQAYTIFLSENKTLEDGVLADFLAEEFSNFIQFMEEGESGESYVLDDLEISIV